MSTTGQNSDNALKWQDLIQPQAINEQQLEKIESDLDLVLLTMGAIAPVSSEAILQAAKDLDLESVVSDRLSRWRLRSANPQRNLEERKKLDLKQARALILIICHLANQHQELLRRAVNLLERVSDGDRPPHQIALLGNYLDRFVASYREKIEPKIDNDADLSSLAWKLLIDLLFYSGQNGHRLLWIAIFDVAKQSPNRERKQ